MLVNHFEIINASYIIDFLKTFEIFFVALTSLYRNRFLPKRDIYLIQVIIILEL